jgi:hypothetical protein
VCSPAVLRVLLCRAPGYRQHHHQLEVHTGESDGSGTGHDVVVEVVVEGGGGTVRLQRRLQFWFQWQGSA